MENMCASCGQDIQRTLAIPHEGAVDRAGRHLGPVSYLITVLPCRHEFVVAADS